MKRLLFGSELLFLSVFWWQTRFNLLHWWPAWAGLDGSIDYLIPFIYLSDMLFGVVLVVWGVGELRIKNYGLSSYWERFRGGLVTPDFKLGLRVLSRPGFWFGMLLLAGVLSLLINRVGVWGWYRWFKLIEGGMIAWWVSKRWRDSQRRRWYGGVLLVGLGFEAMLMIGEWWRQASLGWQWLGEWWFTVHTPGMAKVVVDGRTYVRPMGTFAHPNIGAAVMVASLPLAWWWKEGVRNMEYRVRVWKGWEMRGEVWRKLRMAICWGWMGLILMAIGLSYSRGAWVAMVGLAVGALIYKWHAGLQIKRDWGRGRWWVWGGVIGAAIGVGWLVGSAVVGRFSSLAGSDSWSATLRWQLLHISWQMWLRHPWGVGLNNFTYTLAQNMGLYHLTWWQPVHNVLALVLGEMGLLGVLGLMGLLVVTAGWLGKRLYSERWFAPKGVWVLAGVWVVVIGLGMIDHYWWTSQQAFLVVWGVGGGTVLYKRIQASKDPNTPGKYPRIQETKNPSRF